MRSCMKGKLTRAMTTFHSIQIHGGSWKHTYVNTLIAYFECCALGHNSYLLTLRGKGMHYSLNLQYFFTHVRYKKWLSCRDCISKNMNSIFSTYTLHFLYTYRIVCNYAHVGKKRIENFTEWQSCCNANHEMKWTKK